MRYIPPGVTDIQLYGVCKATVHDPDPGYYRCCFPTNHTHKCNLQLSCGCCLIGLGSTAPGCSCSDVLYLLLLGILYTSTCGMASLQTPLSSNHRHSRQLCQTHKRRQLAFHKLVAETLVSHARFHWSCVIRAYAVCLETKQVVLQGMMPKLC